MREESARGRKGRRKEREEGEVEVSKGRDNERGVEGKREKMRL